MTATTHMPLVHTFTAADKRVALADLERAKVSAGRMHPGRTLTSLRQARARAAYSSTAWAAVHVPTSVLEATQDPETGRALILTVAFSRRLVTLIDAAIGVVQVCETSG